MLITCQRLRKLICSSNIINVVAKLTVARWEGDNYMLTQQVARYVSEIRLTLNLLQLTSYSSSSRLVQC